MMEEQWVNGSLVNIQREEMQTLEVRIEQPAPAIDSEAKSQETAIKFAEPQRKPTEPRPITRPTPCRLHGEQETDMEAGSILRGLKDADARAF